MPEPPISPRKRSRWLRWGIAIFFFAAVLPCLLFVAAGYLVNQIRIPQAQQQTPKYLAISGSSSTPTSSTLSTDKPFAVALRGKSDRPVSRANAYEQFLEDELRDKPNLEGARIGLELARMYYAQRDPVVNPISAFSRIRARNKDNPQAAAAIAEIDQWLLANREIVGKFLRLAESEGLPIRPVGMVTQLQNPDDLPLQGFWMIIGVDILAAEGRRLFDMDDFAGADRCWRASLRLSVMSGIDPDYSGVYSIVVPIEALKHFLVSDAGREYLPGFRAALASAHKLLFPADGHREYLAWVIAARRKAFINSLNHSWKHPDFGWEATDPTRYTKYHAAIAGFELPRLDRMAVNAMFAMRVKQQSAQIMRDFDVTYAEIVRRASATWPEIVASEPFRFPEPPWPISERFYDRRFFRIHQVLGVFGYSPFDVRKWARYEYCSPETAIRKAEARLNLTRAAIECALTTETQVESVPRQIDRESPWRDPFTEQPLRVMDGTSNTLTIYSLGPDMQDQRAAVTYDPTNGVISPGDIW